MIEIWDYMNSIFLALDRYFGSWKLALDRWITIWKLVVEELYTQPSHLVYKIFVMDNCNYMTHIYIVGFSNPQCTNNHIRFLVNYLPRIIRISVKLLESYMIKLIV